MQLNLTKPLIIFDLEATGVNVGSDRIVEIAMLKVFPDGHEEFRRHLINPTIPMPEIVIAIHGITDEMVKDCSPFAARVSEIRDALENCDAVIAHNLSFDMEMIDTEFERCGMKIKWPDRKICTVEETTCMKGYRLSLSDLHKELCGMSFEGAHRAMQDVNALVRCVEILFDRGFI